jgi:hypothetical protein
VRRSTLLALPWLIACTPLRPVDELALAPAGPAVFVEARPRLTSNELFGALRGLEVELWIAADRRLGVRVTN